MQTNEPTIKSLTPKPLESHIFQILSRMFTGYARVSVRSEFTSGLSSGRVFLVRPIPLEGAELPVVVKIDYGDRIAKEHASFHRFTRNRLPRMAEIRGEPVYTADSTYGGLCYPFVGSGEFAIRSLHNHLQEAPLEDIQKVLTKQLFPALETLWQQARKGYFDFCLEDYYDSFLPMNLVIEATSLTEDVSPKELTPSLVRSQTITLNDPVQITGFQVVKVNRKDHKLSLDIPPSSADFTAYRVQVTGINDITSYQVGQTITTPLTGIIRETRASLLQKQVQKVVGAEVDLAATTIPLSPQQYLPNPLVALPTILSTPMDVFLGTIHGDLNLQNILVETENQNAYLIDFAQSRQDHLLRDLLHLEMAVVTKIIPQQMAHAGLNAAAIVPFYERLHCAWQTSDPILPQPELEKSFATLLLIRLAAQKLLYKSNKWQEYYYGLFVYLLGALRYDDLDAPPLAPLPKQIVFWGAAAICQIMRQQPDCGRFLAKTTLTALPANPHTSADPTTVFHNVTGQVHTGSGNINIYASQPPAPQVAPTSGPPLTYRPNNRVAFLNILKEHFNLSELRELCLELEIDYENLAGSSKADKARELLLYCDRHGLGNKLLQTSSHLRPNAPWHTLSN
jgi:hypothetical protein